MIASVKFQEIMVINPALQRPLDDYIAYWEHLTLRSVPLLGKHADPGMRFKDPFNDVTGSTEAARVFAKMFEDTDRPKFRVTDSAWGREGHTAYLRWSFTFYPKGSETLWQIEGMSEVMFNTEGMVVSHVDYWDSGSQLLAKLPVIGWFWELLRKKMAG